MITLRLQAETCSSACFVTVGAPRPLNQGSEVSFLCQPCAVLLRPLRAVTPRVGKYQDLTVGGKIPP